MILKPTGKCDLEHRAYFLRGMAGRSAVVAASEDGHISSFDSDFKPLQRHRLAPKMRAVCPHPSEQWIAWADGETGALVVQTFSGNQLTEIQPPQWCKDASRFIKQGFHDCFFDEHGKFLWAVGPISDEEVEVQLIDVQDWNIVQQMPVEDQFGASDCSLHGTCNPSLVSLWVAAGQDGQQVFWLMRKGSRFTSAQEEQLVNTTPPVFSPDGLEFLVVNEDNAICKPELTTRLSI